MLIWMPLFCIDWHGACVLGSQLAGVWAQVEYLRNMEYLQGRTYDRQQPIVFKPDSLSERPCLRSHPHNTPPSLVDHVLTAHESHRKGTQ